MGWWTRRSDSWRMAIIAQLGGGVVFGAGGFFLSFRAPELGRRKPLFLALAAGAAAGGSIGGAAGIPYSTVVRRLINPDTAPSVDEVLYSPLDGRFSCADIQGAQFTIVQVGASAAVVGAQIVSVECRPWQLFGLGGTGTYFTTRHQVPTDLPSLGQAVVDTPQLQGGLGVIAAGMTGSLWYIG